MKTYKRWNEKRQFIPAKSLEQLTTSMVKQAGFSFLEIMIIIVIMAGIAAIVGPSLFQKLDEARTDQAKIQMKSLSAALDLYHLDNYSYPTTGQGLKALITRPDSDKTSKWKGPYLKGSSVPKDPWSRDFIYSSDGKKISLMSLGADGETGGEGNDADIQLD